MSFSISLWNLVSTINMNAYHLRKSEVVYELRIRDLPTTGKCNELRKRLSQNFASNTEVVDAVVNSLDASVELECCETTLEDLTALVLDYEGDFKDNEYHRTVARLWHLYLRVERIPVAAGEDEEQEETKADLQKKTKELMESFKEAIDLNEAGPSNRNQDKEMTVNQNDETDKKSEPEFDLHYRDVVVPRIKGTVDKSKHESSTSSTLPSTSQPKGKLQDIQSTYPDCHITSFKPKYVPVYKWGLKFDNTGPSIAAFLERVEELRRARGVTHQELFESAVDLFAGAALVWYRSSASRIHSWIQLSKELREVFQPPDYDFRLHQEIFNRVQGEQEYVDLYIAAMEGLYGRLSTQIPEASKLAQIYNNLHPQLQDRLALFDIKTLEELRFMGRRAEAGRLRTTRPRTHPRNDTALEPDLAYQDTSRRRGPPAGIVASVRESSAPVRPDITCWNCHRKGHRFMNCRNPRNKFCYGCGGKDVIKKDCPKCNPKN